ncbi:MAG: sialate O-acetylesterase [Planctomycetaceae bacterium]|nr:sialate O-acetylesterase [Planctomycetaceae bacterium]
MRLLKVVSLAALFGGLSASAARADVKPHPIFSDNMVLQQGTEVAVFGTAAPGEQVNVTLERKTATEASASASGITADKDGKWAVKLGKQKAGTGFTLTIKGKNTAEFKNVAVGEVWVCSGQSNMEWSVNAGETPEKVKEGAKNPNLRLYTVKKRTAPRPIDNQDDLSHFTAWVESSPETVGGFSAVAYHFGQKLQKELDVPVGLIHTSWGGTPAQAWTSLEALDADPSLKYYAEAGRAAAKAYDSYDQKAAMAAYEKALEKWKIDAAKAKADGKPEPKQPAKPGATAPALGSGTPGVLYNAMIHPLLAFKVKGAIWYQGESNAGKAFEYRTLFPAMIEDWRKRFGCELPFMLVQLAPFWDGNSEGVRYAELRDSQLYTTKKLPKVGMAVITDVGDEKDIHPKPKGPVGERLALAALGIEYGKKIVHSGPVFKDAKFDGATATLNFDHVGGGLVAKGDGLAGFTVAGADGVFVPAKATIKGDSIIVTSDKVEKVTAVRYGWLNFAKPTLNLFNKEGLPATPFRTDETPYTTAPKK